VQARAAQDRVIIGADACHTSVKVEQGAVYGLLITISEKVDGTIISENTIKGKVRFDNKAKNVYISGNLGTE